MRFPQRGGGFPAIWYTLQKAREVGPWRLWRAMRTRNACKTCALGMGGQAGGMVNEAGHFPEVCKKSLQAMVADMQGAIRPEFFARYGLSDLRHMTPRELENCGRLTVPLVHRVGEKHYAPISWDEALDLLVGKLKQIDPNESFWYFSGRSSNEAAFLAHLVARLYGTNNVNNCSDYCRQASGVALGRALGTGTATLTLEDVEHADLVLVIGGNPASNHPRLMRTLMSVRRRGGDVIVINPVVETGMVNFAVPSDMRSLLLGSPIASQYVQPHIGGDVALLTGVAKRVLELGAADEAFLTGHCEDWPKLRRHLEELDWSQLELRCGVDRPQIDAVARRYAQSKKAVFAWTMGVTHHVHGVENVLAICNLALLRGMVGRPHAGLLPIRGHSNVQGIGSMGVAPQLKDTLLARLESHFGVKLPQAPGLDTMAVIEAAHAGRLKAGVCCGGNLFGSNPDAGYAATALGRLDLLVYLSTTLNTGHAHGLAAQTLILPVLARDEEPQPTTQESMFNFVRLSDGGPARHAGPRSEVDLFATLAQRLVADKCPIDWTGLRQHGQLRRTSAQIVPGWEALAEIETTKREFQIAGRTFHEPGFPTANGKARLFPLELPPLAAGLGQLRMMTVRSEGQFNTVVYEEYDLYRGQDRRDVILMHPDDLARLGLRHDQPVLVRSEVGQLAGIVARAFPSIKPGNALMYCPEANVLVPRHVDPASRTPAFKNVLVSVEPLLAPLTVGDTQRSTPALASGTLALAGATPYAAPADVLQITQPPRATGPRPPAC